MYQFFYIFFLKIQLTQNLSIILFIKLSLSVISLVIYTYKHNTIQTIRIGVLFEKIGFGDEQLFIIYLLYTKNCIKQLYIMIFYYKNYMISYITIYTKNTTNTTTDTDINMDDDKVKCSHLSTNVLLNSSSMNVPNTITQQQQRHTLTNINLYLLRVFQFRKGSGICPTLYR